MTQPMQKPTAPWELIGLGLLVGVLGGGLFIAVGVAADLPALALVGYLVAGVASILVTVGTVAAGVRLGNAHTEWERQQRD